MRLNGLRRKEMQGDKPGILTCWFRKRIENNKNAIVTINGATGSGKTYCGLDQAVKGSIHLNTNFNIKDNVAFDFPTLLLKTRLPQNQQPETFYVFEEPGAVKSGASSREWQSQANRFFTSFLQTTRHKRQILILTCPMFSSLDILARSLTHVQIIMDYINFKSKQSYAIPYFLQVNSRTGKIYFKKLRYYENDKRHRLDYLISNLPPTDIIRDYEKEKQKYSDRLETMILESAELQRRKDLKLKATLTTAITPERVLELHNKGMTTIEIAKLLCVSDRTIRRYKKRQIATRTDTKTPI